MGRVLKVTDHEAAPAAKSNLVDCLVAKRGEPATTIAE